VKITITETQAARGGAMSTCGGSGGSGGSDGGDPHKCGGGLCIDVNQFRSSLTQVFEDRTDASPLARELSQRAGIDLDRSLPESPTMGDGAVTRVARESGLDR